MDTTVDLSGPVDTPAGMTPALDIAAISGVPSIGTGLDGAVYANGSSIWNLSKLYQMIAESGAPLLTFTASEVLYGGGHSTTSVAEFLGDDAASLSGDGSAVEMGPSGIVLTGYVYIPLGVHAISISSDDGFALSLGGVEFSSFEGTRSDHATTRVAEFEGGLYEVDLAYFDASGRQSLSFEIDGLPVDQSAFYQSVEDFQTNAGGGELVPVEEYHPSQFLGAQILSPGEELAGTDGNDVIDGQGGDDQISGADGDDQLLGGYGDDILDGGAGNDYLMGGRGSDLLLGGAGDDLLVSRSDAGEQRIGQLAVGEPTRGDPDGEVNLARQKLAGWEDQPLIGDDILVGGEGKDTFLIAPQINAKLDIIEKHVRSDGSINWAGVAGENDELHDHWTDSFGIDVIADYKAGEDLIAVIGHTATVEVEHRDIDGDGEDESIITVISDQGNGGGAHDQDLIGQVIVHGDLVNADDIVTDAGVTYGVVENIADVAEALYPEGETKVTTINGRTVFGYDTRNANGGDGPITGNPEDYVDNPFADSGLFAYASQSGEVQLNSRAPFDQLGTLDVAGQNIVGGSGNDSLAPDYADAAGGLPGALGFWSFANGDQGLFDDARGGPSAGIYELYENQAILQTETPLTDGPDGTPTSALVFDGEDDFGFIAHDASYEVTQGTIALWVRPDELDSGKQIILSKDQRTAGEGGHFRLGLQDDGRVFLRFAEGDGGGNKSWTSSASYLNEGEWAHLAVSFTEEGVTVYVDGAAIPDFGWERQEGNVDNPGIYKEAYLLQNAEPWILGADTARTDENETAAQFAADDDHLHNAFAGAIAEFGIWGGYTAADALDASQVFELATAGPGTALTAPSGQQPILAGDDVISGGAGFDEIEGGGGDDSLSGGDGFDSIEGGYGNDILDGGAGNDVLHGGRGSDLLLGGAGDDLLVSRSDAGEQKIGQVVIGEPTREDPDNEVNDAFTKLYGWEDQTLVADDILVGGEGRDTYYFNPQINAKKDIILEHVEDDRTINWAGVAGENDELHDHWVDSFGIDVIADYNADEDTIAIIGHTVDPEVSYQLIDSDGDGVMDKTVSIITVYSDQGGGGGAHTDDLIGQIIVHGDLVDEDDLVVDAGVTHGIVDTVDEIQEAMAPTGETKTTMIDGELVNGYDTRDADGNLGAIIADPEAFVENPYMDSGLFELAGPIPKDLGPAKIVLQAPSASFDGADDFQEIPHQAALAQASGTVAFSFTADDPGNGYQTLLSKDASGYADGGHLTMWVSDRGTVKVRYQSTDQSIYLEARNIAIQAGIAYQLVFTFDEDETNLYIDGVKQDADIGFEAGMSGNTESLVMGASTTSRSSGERNHLKDFFDGTISGLTVADRALVDAEVYLLAEAEGDFSAIEATQFDGSGGAEEAGEAQMVVGTLAELDQQMIENFGNDDEVVIMGETFLRDQMSKSARSATINVDSDGDGSTDGSVMLAGDFSDGDFVTTRGGGNTSVTFREFLNVSERQSLSDGEINGIANQDYLSGDNANSFDVTILTGSGAGYQNALGVYEIDDGGAILDVRLLTADAKADAGMTFRVDDVENGNDLGFFLIQNGGATVSQAVLASTALSFVDRGDGKLVLADGGAIVEEAQSFLSHDVGLNFDGAEHVVSGAAEDGSGGLLIGFEDLTRLPGQFSDDDFEDVVLAVEAVYDVI